MSWNVVEAAQGMSFAPSFVGPPSAKSNFPATTPRVLLLESAAISAYVLLVKPLVSLTATNVSSVAATSATNVAESLSTTDHRLRWTLIKHINTPHHHTPLRLAVLNMP